jgi:hypothetical protein
MYLLTLISPMSQGAPHSELSRTNPPNQGADDRRPAGLPVPGFPRPEQTEAVPVPGDLGLRLGDEQSPIGPDLK